MLNAGRGVAEPGVRILHPHKASSKRANIFVYRQLFAHLRGRHCNDLVYTGFGSLIVASPTPGSAPSWSPRPALSIIGQLRSPSLYFDTPSTIWLDKRLIFNILYIVADIETRHATSLLMAKSHFDTPSYRRNNCQLSIFNRFRDVVGNQVFASFAGFCRFYPVVRVFPPEHTSEASCFEPTEFCVH